LSVQRPLLITMMILTVVLVAVGGYEFLGLGE